jgi:hypothetical protein
MCNELDEKPVRIPKRDDTLFVEACLGMLEVDVMLDESLDPEPDRARKNRESGYTDLPIALSSPAGAGPGKEGEYRPRISGAVTKIEMVCGWIVEVHRALDEPKAEHAGVEVEILLRIARDRGDVVDAFRDETAVQIIGHAKS